MRDLGTQIDHALCVIDRQEGGAEALAADGIRLRLTSMVSCNKAEQPG